MAATKTPRAHPADAAFDAFYDNQTPANAIRLAIADHRASNHGRGSEDFIHYLNVALDIVEVAQKGWSA